MGWSRYTVHNSWARFVHNRDERKRYPFHDIQKQWPNAPSWADVQLKENRPEMKLPDETEEEWNSKLQKKEWTIALSYDLVDPQLTSVLRKDVPFGMGRYEDTKVDPTAVFREERSGDGVKKEFSVITYETWGYADATIGQGYLAYYPEQKPASSARSLLYSFVSLGSSDSFTPLADLDQVCQQGLDLWFAECVDNDPKAQGYIKPAIVPGSIKLKTVEWNLDLLEPTTLYTDEEMAEHKRLQALADADAARYEHELYEDRRAGRAPWPDNSGYSFPKGTLGYRG